MDTPPDPRTDLTDAAAAAARLAKIAQGDTHQSLRVENFLLAWWNAKRDGGFDFTDFWAVDAAIRDDMLIVVGYIAGHPGCYPDTLGIRADCERLALARGPAKAKSA